MVSNAAPRHTEVHVPELRFQAVDVAIADRSATPAIALRIELSNAVPQETIHSILLRSQVQIEAPRRRYSPREQAELKELFGDPAEWGRTLKPVVWANATNVVGSFDRSVVVDVMLPCTMDLYAAVGAYFGALEDGTVPLTSLFSGTIFYQPAGHALQAAPISWNAEARFAFPVALWKECVERHYANTVWLPIRRDIYELLRKRKADLGLATFDDVLERSITGAAEVVA